MIIHNPNPYRDRTALLSADSFFGRRKELADTYGRLADGMSVALVGERRMGKSSVLNALKFPDFRSQFGIPENWRFTYLDAQSIGRCTEEELIKRLLSRMKQNCDQLNWQIADRDALRRAFEVFVQNGLRSVVMLDEFDLLTSNENIGPDFFGVLRSLSAEFQVPFVVAFRESNLDRLISEDDVGSAFLNVFSSVFIGPFQPDDARQLVLLPAARLGIQFSDADLERILAIAGHFPFFIQIACFHLFNARQRGCSADFESLEEPFILEASPHFRYLTHCLTQRERSALRAFMKGTAVEARGLEQLVMKGVLIRSEGKLRLFSTVFKDSVEEQLEAVPESGGYGTRAFLHSAAARLLE
jgi:serine/threonine-protein kinase